MRTKKPNFNINDFLSLPRIEERDIAFCLDMADVKAIVKDISQKNNIPLYYESSSPQNKMQANYIVNYFFRTADKNASLDLIRPSVVPEELKTEVSQNIMKTRGYNLINSAIIEILDQLYPQKCDDILKQKVEASIIKSILDTGKQFDNSKPIDSIKNINSICAYVPIYKGNNINPSSIMTSHWTDRSTALTIKPDEVFLSFLKMVNISTEEWKEAILSEFDVELTGELSSDTEDYEYDRHEAWKQINQEADLEKEALIDVVDLVYAIDNCQYGFTPLVAFKMNVQDVLNRDWNEPVKITGGILGLHDFINGSGDPIRFEGSLDVNPHFTQMISVGMHSHSIGAVQGFVDQSFKSCIEDGYEEPVFKI